MTTCRSGSRKVPFQSTKHYRDLPDHQERRPRDVVARRERAVLRSRRWATSGRDRHDAAGLQRARDVERLIEIARDGDDGQPKTGRRFYYLALSYGYIQPDMSPEGKASRDAAYKRVTKVLGVLRMQGRLAWDAVLDLTRELNQWQTYESPRQARAAMRRRYDEDRWLGQPHFPILIVEKDTLEPVCRPMASRWQMPFASSRGYGSLTLQHDVAEMLRDRHA